MISEVGRVSAYHDLMAVDYLGLKLDDKIGERWLVEEIGSVESEHWSIFCLMSRSARNRLQVFVRGSRSFHMKVRCALGDCA